MNIYLDIDGVLLHDSLDQRGVPANHSEELIKFLVDNFQVYWLTTHCHGGGNNAPEYLKNRFPNLGTYIEKIKPTDWGSWKTDAIDFGHDFRWLDDDVYKPELDKLTAHNSLDKLIKVNLREKPDQLSEIMKSLNML